MIINHEKKFIHIAIPRTGTTTINYILGNRTHPEPDKHHMGLFEVMKNFPETTGKGYYAFTFVRNPYEKLVSTFTEFTKNRLYQYSAKIKFEHTLLSEFTMYGWTEIENFRLFCKELGNSVWFYDVFFRPQYAFTAIPGIEDGMSYTGHLETIQSDWNIICNIIGLGDIPLPDKRADEPRGHMRSSEHAPWEDYYNDETREIVYNLYKRDFRIFGYEK